MAAVNPPLFQTVDGEYNGAHLGLPYRDWVREGVLGSGDMVVSQRGAGPNMSVDVAAGVAWVLGDSASLQPTYRCMNDATVNLAVDAAHGSLDRVDLVAAEVRDAAFSGVSTDWRLLVITGTPHSSPTPPAVPASTLPLAFVSVPASATSVTDGDITDVRPRAQLGAAGGMVPVVTSPPAYPHNGMMIDVVADAGAGVVWRFRYRSGSSHQHKWEFVGGSPLQQRTYGDVDTTSTSYTALSGSPTITVPLTGEYAITHGVRQFYSVGGPGNAVTETEVFYNSNPCGCEISAHTPAVSIPLSGMATNPVLPLTAGDVVQQRYKAGTGVTSVFGRRTLTICPVRVG